MRRGGRTSWHGRCVWKEAMKRYCGGRGGEKCQIWLGAVLLAGIVAAALAPNPRAGKGGRTDRLFSLVEADYYTPYIGSYAAVRPIPFQSGLFEGFAGYDQLPGKIEILGRASVVQVTRFAGRLLELAEVPVIARRASEGRKGNAVYLSETFWRVNLAGSKEVLGAKILVHGKSCWVAGITREPRGLFAGTQIWLALDSRDIAARSSSMRIIGRLSEGANWADAGKEFERLTRRTARESGEFASCRLVSATGTLHVNASPARVGRRSEAKYAGG